MPSDIRSFFGGKPSGTPAQNTPQKEEKKKGRGRPKKTVIADDSDDEVPAPQKATPKKAAPKPKKLDSPKETVTSTSDYFGSSNRPKRSEAKTKPISRVVITPHDTPKSTSKKVRSVNSTPNGSGTPVRKRTVSAIKAEDEYEIRNEDEVSESGPANGKKVDHEENNDEDMVISQRKKTVPRGRKSKVVKDEDEDDFQPDNDVDMKDVDRNDDFVVPDDDEEITSKRPAKTAAASRKRKAVPVDDEEDDDEPPAKGRKKAASTTAAKSPMKKKTKKDEPENAATQAIFDSITQVRAPTPPPPGEQAKFNFAARAAHQNSVSQSSGSFEPPTGADNCLAGLKFVFTGVLQSLDRDTGKNLVKQYGGKVQNSASTVTDFVVLGSDAGAKKLQVIAQHKIKTIDEHGLFDLIKKMPANGGSGKAAASFAQKQAKDEANIRAMAAEMEKQEKEAAKAAALAAKQAAAKGSSSKSAPPPPRPAPPMASQLWTVKYAPTAMDHICGNKTQVEKLQNWLRNFQKNQRKGFRMPGRDGSGVFRAVIIHGPPGIGKTTAAHVIAKEEGYDIVESNASDSRSKKLVDEGLKGVLDTTSLLGYFAGDGKKVEVSKRKIVLIMDEVDGMSAGDRGGVGALAKICKTTNVPMILICNDRRLQKMKPFDHVTFDLSFRRPTVDQIRARMMSIAYKEGVSMSAPVLNALIEGSGADIRQVVNMLSTVKLDQMAMDFDAGKKMSKAWEKHTILKPWDIVGKILGGAMFAESSKATLIDKTELYFNDHEFSYLMLQENYLGTSPMRANGYKGNERNLKLLELVSNAADSISDGDLVDRMIHGSQQQWSLMPTHAIFSFVRPASFVSGSMSGYGQTRFTSWLGQNSKTGKLGRFVKEIQGHMRLRATGSASEIRLQYLPSLWSQLVARLEREGKDAVPSIIELMDSYFLTRDDFDAILELGVGRMDMEKVKIESQAKATFTRLYNLQSHPLPFMKASQVVAPAKVAKVKPDLEEALDEEDEEVEPDAAEVKAEEDQEADLKKDKYIKAPKKKAAPKVAAKGAAKGKAAGKGKGRKPAD